MIRSLAFPLSFVLLLLLQACAGYGPAKDSINKVDSPVWIDVRTDGEYQAGHVDEAVNIPFEVIADRITALELAPDQPIYLYCGSGRRAGIALETLSDLGYTNLANLGSFEDAQQWPKKAPAQSPAHYP